MENIEKEVLDSMKKLLDDIDRKLQDEKLLEDPNETARLQEKRKWVDEKIKEWQEFISQ